MAGVGLMSTLVATMITSDRRCPHLIDRREHGRGPADERRAAARKKVSLLVTSDRDGNPMTRRRPLTPSLREVKP